MTHHRNTYLEAADRIASRLCRDAIWSGDICNWMGWSFHETDQTPAPAYKAFGADLYQGTSGIALFLAHLWQFSGDDIHRATLEGAVNHVLTYYEDLPKQGSGFFEGRGGPAWTLVEIGRIIGEEKLIQLGLDLVEKNARRTLKPQDLDVINGAAGVIPVYLQLAIQYDRERLFHGALAAGEHLLDQAEKGKDGWRWNTSPFADPAYLSGYSHGAAGIAAAMLELYGTFGDPRFKEAAQGARAFERGLFDPERGNWSIRRVTFPPTSRGPAFGLSWCHGAPGIGLSRLRCMELGEDDPELSEELDAALAATSATLVDPPEGLDNFSLCHGLAGNADLLIEAARVLNRKDLHQRAEDVGLTGINQYNQQGGYWTTGTGVGESPSLMLGLAGTGYFYLRLYDPIAVPSVLLRRGGAMTEHLEMPFYQPNILVK